jgi:hypothetical protein
MSSHRYRVQCSEAVKLAALEDALDRAGLKPPRKSY